MAVLACRRVASVALLATCMVPIIQAKNSFVGGQFSSQQAVLTEDISKEFLSQALDNPLMKREPGAWDSQAQLVFRKEIREAVKAALGCGEPVKHKRLAAHRASLLPMWESLPKNSYGRVERRVLRYVVHRYFLRHFGIWVRGFEPMHLNQSQAGAADILSERVLWYVETTLESQHAVTHGFSVDDAVYMIVVVEQLLLESEGTLLEHVYMEEGKSMHKSLRFGQVRDLIWRYILHWFVGEDIHSDGQEQVFHDLTFLTNPENKMRLPSWMQYLLDFVHGQMRTFQWLRQRGVQDGHSGPSDAWKFQYSFDDAHKIVAEITSTFALFWQGECRKMKDALVRLDVHRTGRVPLARFYGAEMQNHRFHETVDYLRELGALDETSSLWGRQVIIPNYVQSAANCQASTSHYMVCCFNECERILDEIESAIGASSAAPVDLVRVVSNITLQSTLDDDDTVELGDSFVALLESIASNNNGQVQLHGRLFAQWLHYVFPQECPFPHKLGTVVQTPAREFSNASIAAPAVRKAHAEDVLENFAIEAMESMSTHEMSIAWSPEEELVMEVGAELPDPGFNHRFGLATFLSIFLFAMAVSYKIPFYSPAASKQRSHHI